MSKYNKEFKQKAVDAYLAGEGGYNSLAKRFGVPSHENIRKWVVSFNQLGENSLINKKTRSSYPVKFKLGVGPTFPTKPTLRHKMHIKNEF